MKKVFTVLAILLAFGSTLSAQVPGSPVSIYAGGALSIPTAPESFKSYYKNGYHGFVGIGLPASPVIELVGKVEYHTFSFDFDQAYSEYSGGTNKVWMFGGDVKVNPSLPAFPVSPYLLGGLGFAAIQQTEFDGPPSLTLSLLNESVSENQTKLFWNIGGGFSLATSPVFSLFAQVRYVNIATDNESSAFIPVTVGLKFF
ncbi:MAG: outer membrane beta-barrel protein [Candidatus Zixiibacteriota bacterium]